MATIAQHKLLTALLDGMALTDTERVQLLSEHVEPLEVLRYTKIDDKTTVEDIMWIIEEALSDPKPWAPNHLLPEESGRKMLAAKIMDLMLPMEGRRTFIVDGETVALLAGEADTQACKELLEAEAKARDPRCEMEWSSL